MNETQAYYKRVLEGKVWASMNQAREAVAAGNARNFMRRLANFGFVFAFEDVDRIKIWFAPENPGLTP